MRELACDVRDSWRGLRRDRLYAATVVGTLALALGAAMAAFSIVNGVLLRPLAYPQPQALVSIREILPTVADRYPTLPATMRHFDVWRRRATSFSAMAAMDWRTATLTGLGEASQVTLLRSSGTLFDVLQAPVAFGRGLQEDDESLARPRVAVVSDLLWRERLGADPGVLGRSIVLNGTQYAIVGVLPAGYSLPKLQPLGESGVLTSDLAAIVPFRVSLADFDWMGQFNYGVVARLKPGAGFSQALAEMNVLQGTVAEIAKRETHEPAALRAWMMPLGDAIVGPVRRALLLVIGAIGALLLIACANLANLTLTRTIARRREAAIRGALGAGRWRLARAVVVDQLVLAAAGSVLALAIARAALRVFVTTAPRSLPRVSEVVIDGRVLAVGAALTLCTAVAVALLPAWRIGRDDLETILRSGGRTSDPGGHRIRGTLLTAQVALSVVMLVVGGLFVSSLVRLLGVETGFAPGGAVTIELAPGSSRYPDTAARAALYDRILERVHALPAVTAAAWTSALPLTGETWVDQVKRAEPGSTAASSANYRFIGPEYFDAIGMPILQGRTFGDRERAAAAAPAVISRRTARALWPGEDAIGRVFTRADPTQHLQVVGVVGDGRVTSLEAEAPLMVYVPYWFNNEGKSILVVRSHADLAAVAAGVREAVRGLDPDIAIARVAALDDVFADAVEGRRYQALLFAAFGAAALLTAVIGVYATTAFSVSRRRRELNIRVALGAQVGEVFSLVLRQSAVPVVIGLAGGLAGALAVGGVVASLLYDVPPRDPMVLAAVLTIVASVGIGSAAAATVGGLHIEPASALRDE